MVANCWVQRIAHWTETVAAPSFRDGGVSFTGAGFWNWTGVVFGAITGVAAFRPGSGSITSHTSRSRRGSDHIRRFEVSDWPERTFNRRKDSGADKPAKRLSL